MTEYIYITLYKFVIQETILGLCWFAFLIIAGYPYYKHIRTISKTIAMMYMAKLAESSS